MREKKGQIWKKQKKMQRNVVKDAQIREEMRQGVHTVCRRDRRRDGHTHQRTRRERARRRRQREVERSSREVGGEVTSLHEVGAVWSPVWPILGPQL